MSPLISIVKSALAKVKVRGDVPCETMDYFFVKNPKLGRFYLLPKIHKRLHNVPGRPVISNSGYFTENISAYVDHHLQPLSKNVKSFIKDTNDFLRKLRALPELPDDCLLCTIDVVGLYPNIPHDEGLSAVRNALNTREDQSVSTDSIVDLAECVLKNNTFEHNSEFYRQLQGTAIGTKMAPPYAILFLAELEERLIKNWPLKPSVWWRYIDDIFMLWQHGEDKLKEFIEYLNNCHPTIKFTYETSPKSINFLDINVIRVGNRLVSDLYVKPTDTHQYLHATSCHVYHIKKSIPYSQTLRLNRICSEQSFFDKRCNELEKWLMARGYSAKLVREQVLKGRKFSRNELLDREKREKDKTPITFNVTYHPAFSKMKSILSDIHLLLTPDSEHRKVFEDIPLVGFKNGKSLKNYLVRAKVPKIYSPDNLPGSFKCKSKRCEVCTFMKETNSFKDISRDKTLSINVGKLDCNSRFVVYLFQCKTCEKQYVGSSSTKFRTRFNNYKSSWKKHTENKKVPQGASFHAHFSQPDHCGQLDWEVTLIDQSYGTKALRLKEDYWIDRLNTFSPNGLNERHVTWEPS